MTNTLRPGEIMTEHAMQSDAALQFIGVVRTPFASRSECPRQGDPENGPICRLELVEPWQAALRGLEAFDAADILYWLHESRRDLLLQSPHSDGSLKGTFALRSPVRPNPIGLSRVSVVGIETGTLVVRGMDCLDGTPLLDIKPSHCLYSKA